MLDVKGAKIGQLQRHKSKEAGTAAPFAIPLIGHSASLQNQRSPLPVEITVRS
ncbi:hypothetical protein LB543_33625 [Mesorhizobium sp. ESP7-2]|uniref:hypothetical protein n=1 Tax=unclassified Mesorhizobium TaxID=325217 RepID=UPI0015E44701|nr:MULTISPECIES: hypothetical protein [unclassified Mesorhizobium]MBZ9711621.1 hypothetical protein [Mesorhizobium sp. ESP7-2]